MPAAPPYGAIAERRIIQQMLRTNALTASTAQGLELRRSVDHRRLRRLIGEGVVREATPGRYYLDAPALADHLDSRRRRLLVAWLVLIALAFAFGSWVR